MVQERLVLVEATGLEPILKAKKAFKIKGFRTCPPTIPHNNKACFATDFFINRFFSFFI